MRVIIVHDIEQVKAALAAAVEMRRPVTLQTAPDAALKEGVIQLKRMVEAGAAALPRAAYQLIIDCGNDAAIALSAIRAGYKYIRLRFAGAHEMRKTIYDEAGKERAEIVSGLYTALDLADERSPISAALNWLQGSD